MNVRALQPRHAHRVHRRRRHPARHQRPTTCSSRPSPPAPCPARRSRGRWRSSTSYEPSRRGLYGGVVGYLDFAGDLDMAIAIRTAVIKDGVAHVQAGAGIVADSVPTAGVRGDRQQGGGRPARRRDRRLPVRTVAVRPASVRLTSKMPSSCSPSSGPAILLGSGARIWVDRHRRRRRPRREPGHRHRRRGRLRASSPSRWSGWPRPSPAPPAGRVVRRVTLAVLAPRPVAAEVVLAARVALDPEGALGSVAAPRPPVARAAGDARRGHRVAVARAVAARAAARGCRRRVARCRPLARPRRALRGAEHDRRSPRAARRAPTGTSSTPARTRRCATTRRRPDRMVGPSHPHQPEQQEPAPMAEHEIPRRPRSQRRRLDGGRGHPRRSGRRGGRGRVPPPSSGSSSVRSSWCWAESSARCWRWPATAPGPSSGPDAPAVGQARARRH